MWYFLSDNISFILFYSWKSIKKEEGKLKKRDLDRNKVRQADRERETDRRRERYKEKERQKNWKDEGKGKTKRYREIELSKITGLCLS